MLVFRIDIPGEFHLQQSLTLGPLKLEQIYWFLGSSKLKVGEAWKQRYPKTGLLKGCFTNFLHYKTAAHLLLEMTASILISD